MDWGGGATSVNNPGHVTGYFDASESDARAFFWSDTTGLQMLGGPSRTLAFGINDNDQIVGTTGNEGFIWHLGSFTLLQSNSWAWSINNHGDVVGSVDQNSRAVIWRNLIATPLDTLVSESGWRFDQATSINDDGQIVVHVAQAPTGINDHEVLLNPVPELQTGLTLLAACVLAVKTARRTVKRI